MLDFTLSGKEYFDDLPQPVLVYGDTIEYCNDAARSALESLGLTIEVGGAVPELLPPADQAPCVEALADWNWQAQLRPLGGKALCQLSRFPDQRELPPQFRMVARELRLLLSNTALSLERLQWELSELEQLRSTEQVANLNRNFHQLLRLTDHLDLFTRSSEELMLLYPPEAVELHDFCERLHRDVEPLARQLGRRFTLDLAPGPLCAQVNPELLYRLLCNLISNSLRSGGDLHLKLRVRGPDLRDAVLTLSDTGDGISPRQMQGLFLPENRSDQGGLALGLALSARLSQLYHGASFLLSPKESGTIVSVSLPRSWEEDALHAGRAPMENGYNLLLTELSDVLPASMYAQDDVF